MKNSKEESIKAIENTLKNLDINYHKPLIDLLNEYNNKLNTQDYCAPLLKSLKREISICILENNLKIPKEVTELIQTLSSSSTKFSFNYGNL